MDNLITALLIVALSLCESVLYLYASNQVPQLFNSPNF